MTPRRRGDLRRACATRCSSLSCPPVRSMRGAAPSPAHRPEGNDMTSMPTTDPPRRRRVRVSPRAARYVRFDVHGKPAHRAAMVRAEAARPFRDQVVTREAPRAREVSEVTEGRSAHADEHIGSATLPPREGAEGHLWDRSRHCADTRRMWRRRKCQSALGPELLHAEVEPELLQAEVEPDVEARGVQG